MPLTLKIISKQRHILGADGTRVFSVHGGSIGRAPDNDWVLPDPDRYISGHHATIDYRQGAYYLKDTSTNGVFVNHSEEPVGRGTPIRLYDGDELRMGDYIFEVSIVNVSRDGSDDGGDSAGEDDAPRRRLKRRQPAGPSTLKLLGEEASQLTEAASSESFAATVRMPEDEVDERAADFSGTVVHEESATGLDAEPALAPEPARADAPADGPAGGAFDGEAARKDFSEAVRLLMASAGLDASRLPRNGDEEVIVMAGKLIRAAAEGLQNALRSRALIKTQFRLSPGAMQSAGNNALKFMPTTQDALEHLFYDRAEGYLGPVEAVQDALEDLRAHQAAMVKAMQVAFRDLLDRLDPDELETQFQQRAKGGLLSSPKAKYWDLYRDAYQAIAGHSDENFANVIGGKFADAYDREVHKLVSRNGPRGGRGSD
jgi:type VI secretion system FHA domain protein